ncbi:MCE family protein [Nocardia vinacea]|uniref:MCE family protein n=1 Tax=Nocardia vinacea TaxID=96468 RepID=A0ABZ1Z0K1_9NOCA|nr:MCE family protein [Nocardia vinacea]
MFEPDGRGPSSVRLLLTGVCCVVAIAAAATLMVANSRGALRKSVTVTAVMANVGDGLPAKSDVKFQGVRVGLVTAVTPAAQSGMNDVRIELDPHFAQAIPATVTARVVPSNVFAVPSVQLVYNGAAPALGSGARISQDHSLATVRLQTSLDQLRRIIAAVGRDETDDAVGMLAILAEATNGRGAGIENAAARLRDIVVELDKVVSVQAAPSTLDSLSAAMRELQSAAPDLLDAMHQTILPLQTLAQQRAKLTALLSGGLHTLGTVGTALDNNTDKIIDITTHMSPALGAFGDGASSFPQISVSLTRMITGFTGLWNPQTQRLTPRVIVQLTPNRQYTSADCPRYGELAGPNCASAPATPAPAEGLPPGLDPRRFQPPASLLDSDIGPVGSPAEQEQIADILGGKPNAAADILFGPLARGANVSITPDPSGGTR